MGLLSFFKRAEDAQAAVKPVNDGQDAVQQLRLQAKRRLIGAAVLVGIGVIAFPLVFETQPRPIPVDIPIEIPKKDGGLPMTAVTPPVSNAEPVAQIPAKESAPPPVSATPTPTLPQPRVEQPVVSVPSPPPAPALARAEAKPEPKVDLKPEPKAKPDVKSERLAARPADKPSDHLAEKLAEKSAPKPADRQQGKGLSAEKPKSTADRDPDAAKIVAALENHDSAAKALDKRLADVASPASAGRYIVQVGAFAEAKAAQDVRMKVERLGLKTYTQAVDTADGKRIRVRIGPFANRDEADRAAAKLHGNGLAGSILTL